MGEHIKEVALLRVDNFLHLGELVIAEPLLGQSLQQLLPGVRCAPDVPQFRLIIDRLAEVAVGVYVLIAFGRGGHAQLHCRCEVVHDAAPVAFVVRAAAMALVNHNEVEEVWRILVKVGRRLAVLGR